jgi:hypothetical protein
VSLKRFFSSTNPTQCETCIIFILFSILPNITFLFLEQTVKNMFVVASNLYVIIIMLAVAFNCANQAPFNGHCNTVSSDCRSVTSRNRSETQKETVFVFLVSGAVVIKLCCIPCRKSFQYQPCVPSCNSDVKCSVSAEH